MGYMLELMVIIIELFTGLIHTPTDMQVISMEEVTLAGT